MMSSGNTDVGAAAGPILKLENVTRTFYQGTRDISVLQGANAELWAGQAVALVGPSGAGKSTLLHIAGLLEPPTSGRVVVNGRDCAEMTEKDRTRLRRTDIGFIYQFISCCRNFQPLRTSSFRN
jgi:lipoprotein-releasing system ATP-binding protein